MRDDFGYHLFESSRHVLSIAYFEDNFSAYLSPCGWIIRLEPVAVIVLVRLQRVWWPQSKIEGFRALYQSNQTLQADVEDDETRLLSHVRSSFCSYVLPFAVDRFVWAEISGWGRGALFGDRIDRLISTSIPDQKSSQRRRDLQELHAVF